MSIEKDLNELSRISFDEFRKGVGEETANLILTGLLGKTLSMKTFIKLVGEDKFKELLIKAPHLVEQALAEKRKKINEKRKLASSMAIEARWGKKPEPVIEAVQAPEPVAVQPTPAPVQEEVQSQEPIPVIEEAPADYVDEIQKKANEVVDRLEHQSYTAKSIPVQPKTSDEELTNALNDLGINTTLKTGCLGDDWDDNKLLTDEMKQDMRELGLDKVPKNYGQPYDFQFNREKSEAFVRKYSSPQTADIFMTLANGFKDTY